MFYSILKQIPTFDFDKMLICSRKYQYKNLPKTIIVLFLVLTVFQNVLGQQQDSIKYNIELGKRGNILYNRKISFHNIGVYSTAFKRIYFKESKYDEFKSIGFLGWKIKPLLKNNSLAYKEFKKYRNYKLASYTTLASAPIVAIAWLASASYYNRRTAMTRRRSPLNLFPDGAFYLFPFSIFSLSIGSILLNQQADRHLLMATEISNRKIRTLRPKY